MYKKINLKIKLLLFISSIFMLFFAFPFAYGKEKSENIPHKNSNVSMTFGYNKNQVVTWKINDADPPFYYTFEIDNCEPNVQKFICFTTIFVFDLGKPISCTTIQQGKNVCGVDRKVQLQCAFSGEYSKCEKDSRYQLLSYGCVEESDQLVLLKQLNSPSKLNGSCNKLIIP